MSNLTMYINGIRIDSIPSLRERGPSRHQAQYSEALRKYNSTCQKLSNMQNAALSEFSRQIDLLTRHKEDMDIARSLSQSLDLECNPFIIVTLGQDSCREEPLYYTSTLRNNNRPHWRERTSRISLENSYHRSRDLVFSVYHDDGERIDGVPSMSQSSWLRRFPRRSQKIAAATVCLNDLLIYADGQDFEYDLGLIDRNGREIGTMTVVMRLATPLNPNRSRHRVGRERFS